MLATSFELLLSPPCCSFSSFANRALWRSLFIGRTSSPSGSPSSPSVFAAPRREMMVSLDVGASFLAARKFAKVV